MRDQRVHFGNMTRAMLFSAMGTIHQNCDTLELSFCCQEEYFGIPPVHRGTLASSQKCVCSFSIRSQAVLAKSGMPSSAPDLAHTNEVDCSLGSPVPRPIEGESAKATFCMYATRCASRYHNTNMHGIWLRRLREA